MRWGGLELQYQHRCVYTRVYLHRQMIRYSESSVWLHISYLQRFTLNPGRPGIPSHRHFCSKSPSLLLQVTVTSAPSHRHFCSKSPSLLLQVTLTSALSHPHFRSKSPSLLLQVTLTSAPSHPLLHSCSFVCV